MYRKNKKTQFKRKFGLILAVLAVLSIGGLVSAIHLKQLKDIKDQKPVVKAVIPGQLPDDGPGVKAANIEVKDIEVPELVPFTSSNVNDPSIETGTTRVLIAGAPGTNVKIYTVTLEDGKETNRVLKSESLIKNPVNEIISIGSKPLVKTPLIVPVVPPIDSIIKCDKNDTSCN